MASSGDFNKSHKGNVSYSMPEPQFESNIPTLVPMAVLIIIVNCFVMFLFATRKRLRAPSNYLLFSLAVSDLLSGILGIPLFLAFEQTRMLGFITGYITISKLTTASTAYHILIITGEKYLAIVKPLRHHSSNPKKVFYWLGVVWLASSFNALITLIWSESELRDICNMGHDIFSFLTVFLLPYIFIVYCQTVMIKKITKRTREMNLISTKTTKSRNQITITNDKKCLYIFVTMALLFLICWMPWFILMFLLTAKFAVPSWTEKLIIGDIPEEVLKMFVVIRYCTCIINPLLYTFFKRDFMYACKNVFKRCSNDRMNDQQTANLSVWNSRRCTSRYNNNRTLHRISNDKSGITSEDTLEKETAL